MKGFGPRGAGIRAIACGEQMTAMGRTFEEAVEQFAVELR